MPDSQEIRDGAYARRQLFGNSALLRWSHGSRFRKAIRLVAPFAGGRLLDYGSGDGTFIAKISDSFSELVGAEVDSSLASQTAARFDGLPNSDFLHVDRLSDVPDAHFDVAVCMEVMEHCTDQALARVIADLQRLVRPHGRIVVSVPVEVGPALLVKQLARAAAGRSGLEGYRERETYQPGEMLRMILATPRTAILRPLYRSAFAEGVENVYHGHKGFNWRALRHHLKKEFVLQHTTFSPVSHLGPLLNSQAWFVLSPR